ncbi:MAG TPA: IS21 family transposase, partial [Dermatophilaceae bacterium]
PTAGRPWVAPVILARHLIAPTGAGATVRDHGHVLALERSALSASTTERPHRRKERRPPSPAALAQAATLRALGQPDSAGEQNHVVVDLAAYAAAAAGRNTLSPQPPTPPSETIKETKQQ